MLNITIESVREAIECDRCDDTYKQKYGCKSGSSITEKVACQIEHTKWRCRAIGKEKIKGNVLG